MDVICIRYQCYGIQLSCRNFNNKEAYKKQANQQKIYNKAESQWINL